MLPNERLSLTSPGVKTSLHRQQWLGSSCVFIRFQEDNGLLGENAYLSGPGPRLALARDQHTLYFRQHPTESDREYLYHVFRTVRACPAWRRY